MSDPTGLEHLGEALRACSESWKLLQDDLDLTPEFAHMAGFTAGMGFAIKILDQEREKEKAKIMGQLQEDLDAASHA